MPRPGGNPELEKYQFEQKGDSPLDCRVTVRITKDMKRKLNNLADKGEFIRIAIEKALKERAEQTN